ncbi:unnamed protein product [Rangifer tarandus platyrhynchus]|uniref:Uncharacterized protein n=2 Tax=Rangifer tarandus platyrhynchus TaxID=3082113 RepID=A0ABN8Y2F5_RANTA|nr:unnamed protein product [Rangifer tarandus platyrhynchus]
MKKNLCLFISEKELYLVIILDSDIIAFIVCKLFHIGKSSDLYLLWFLLKTKLDVHFCDVMNTFLLYFETFAKLITTTLYNIKSVHGLLSIRSRLCPQILKQQQMLLPV